MWWEYLGYIYAVPVMMINDWEWLDPEFMAILEEVLRKGEKKEPHAPYSG
jgi:hypothetical protein